MSRRRGATLAAALMGGAAILAFAAGPVAASVLNGVGVGVPAGTASPTPPTSAPPSSSAVTVGADSVTLLGQTPYVVSHGPFRLHVALSARQPAGERLQVAIYQSLITRTGFEEAAAGLISGPLLYTTGPLTLSRLSPDPAGGADVDIPVDQTGPTKGPPEVQLQPPQPGGAVYPVQIELYTTSGVPVGTPVTTFFVYSSGPPSVYPKLSVGLSLSFGAPPSVDSRGRLSPLPSATLRSLAALASALSNNSTVPVSVNVTPQTLDALAAGSAAERSTLATLEAAIRARRITAVPATYVQVSPSELDGAGLGTELPAQVNAGKAVLTAAFGAEDATTWVVDGPIDQQTLQAITAAGASRLVVPDGDLSPLPLTAQGLTFAMPTRLDTPGVPSMSAFGADPGLTADFVASGGPALAANRLLAEMAMIQLEQPNARRAVAVVPPVGWVPDPAFVSVVMAGLEGNPLLSAVSAKGLFEAVPDAPGVSRTLAGSGTSSLGSALASGSGSTFGSGSGSSLLPGSTLAPGSTFVPGSTLVPGSTAVPAGGSASTSTSLPSETSVPQGAAAVDPSGVLAARSGVSALGQVFPSERAAAATLAKVLLISESDEMPPSESVSLLSTIQSQVSRFLGEISLPPSTSITLTSTKGQVPLTLLSATSREVRIQLRLSSQRLIFHAFNPLVGTCQVPTPTSEICNLVLRGPNTTLKVPVEARASGVFVLQVSLWTPDGSQLLSQDHDRIRSTAVSNVGIILIVLAVVSLAVWWVRDLRHGRRARRLVPVPEDEADADPLVEQFFSSPPPQFEKPPPSPRP